MYSKCMHFLMSQWLRQGLLVVMSSSSLLAVEATRPNILFIALDDMNDVPAFMGSYKGAVTPNMDRLASRGVVFRQAHSQYPICGPSRASVMSGLLPTTLGVHSHPSDGKTQQLAEMRGSDTIPAYFKRQGYKVMGAGKLFHKHLPKGSYDLSGGRGGWGQYKGGKQAYKTKGTLTDWGVTDENEADMSDVKAAQWVIEQLGEPQGAPFLLMFGTIRPHVPWLVPQAYFDLYPDPSKLTLMAYREDDLEDVPERALAVNLNPEMPRTEWLKESGEWTKMMHAYLASVSFADHYVGEVLKALEKSPYAENTIVVLWSDHGYHLGEKNTTQKHSLWQRATHVPMVIAGPGIEPGQCDRPVGLIDLFPTLADLTSGPSMAAWEGRSLKPLLREPKSTWPHPVITTWQGMNVAVQGERFRYIRYDDGSEELYDHHTDLNEWKNLAGVAEYEPVIERLKAALPKHDATSNKSLDSFFKARAKDWKNRGFQPNGRPLIE